MKFFSWLLLALVFCAAGCGGPSGAEGDANDPAATDDTEQMEDESGEV